MNEREAKLLAIRAADGQLNEEGRRRLDAYCEEHHEVRAFFAAEREAAVTATALCDGLGLDKPLRVRLPRPRKRLWLVGVAAAALLVGMVSWLVMDSATTAPARAEIVYATWETIDGVAPAALSAGAWHAGPGRYRVAVERSALLQTSAGTVQFTRGEYTVVVDRSEVRVESETGEALLKNIDATSVVKRGESGSLKRAVAMATLAAPPPPPAGPARAKGIVLDGENRPIKSARIWVSTSTTPDEGSIVTETDADGRFELAQLDGALRYVGARAPGRAPSDLRILKWEAADKVFDLRIVLGRRGGALRGKVNPPVEGARVFVGGNFRNVPYASASDTGVPLTAVRAWAMTTDAEGAFAADDLPYGWQELRVYAPGHAPHHSYVDLVPGETVDKVVTLQEAAVIVGVVRDDQGTPLANARVSYHWPYHGYRREPGEAVTDEVGAFRLDPVPAGKLELRVDAGERGHAHGRIETKAGEKYTREFSVVAGIDVEGKVVYEDGTPVAKALVWCTAALQRSGDYQQHFVAGADGSFRFTKRRRIVHTLMVWYPQGQTGKAPGTSMRVAPEDGPITIRLPRRPEGWSPGAITGSVLLPDGSSAIKAIVQAIPLDLKWGVATTNVGALGEFRIGALDPGRYKIEVKLEDRGRLSVDEVVVTAGGAADVGELRFLEPGRVRARMIIDGKAVEKVYFQLTNTDRTAFYRIRQVGPGEALSEALAPGRYLLWAGGLGNYQEVVVEENGERVANFAWEKPFSIAVELFYADGTQPGVVSLVISAQGGPSLLDHKNADTKAGRLTHWYIPGDYRIQVSDARGRKGELEFRVDTEGRPDRYELFLR